MRPLRPATDHRLGGPLPRQLANQPRPPLQANCFFDLRLFIPKTLLPVLAPVSRSYPPLEGRLVTCYSPGRHCTHGLLHFLVRLACVRHAASVDSEPGSNSRLKPDCYPTGCQGSCHTTKNPGKPGRNSSYSFLTYFVRSLGLEPEHFLSRLARSTCCQRPNRLSA